MTGEYSIMDFVTFGGLLSIITFVIVTFIVLFKDNKYLTMKIEILSKENVRLKDELSKEHDMIKRDTDLWIL